MIVLVSVQTETILRKGGKSDKRLASYLSVNPYNIVNQQLKAKWIGMIVHGHKFMEALINTLKCTLLEATRLQWTFCVHVDLVCC